MVKAADRREGCVETLGVQGPPLLVKGYLPLAVT